MKQNRTHLLHGGNPVIAHAEIFAFSGTDATKVITVPMQLVDAPLVSAVGTPASDEVLSVDATVTGTPGEDAAIVGSNGSTTLTVTRTGASKTSGLKFSLIAFGR